MRTWKHCPRCDDDLPLSEFGVDRARKDGLNLYCKKCVREKIAAFRLARRQYDLVRSIHRKPSKVAQPIWRMRLKPKDAVLLAIKRGAHDQTAIRHATRLYIDDLTDALADLYAEDKLSREAMRRREYIAA